MGTVLAARTSRRRLGSFAAVLLLWLIGYTTIGTPHASALTYPTAVAGYGKWFPAGAGRPVAGHVGELVIPAKFSGFCLQINRSIANFVSVKTTSDLPDITGDNEKKVINIANEYFVGATKANGVFQSKYTGTTAQRNEWAYWHQFAIWMTNSTNGKSYYNDMVKRGRLTANDVKEINAILSRATAGGLGTVTLTSQKPLVGQSGTATVAARSMRGYYVPNGTPVTSGVTTTNVKINSTSGIAGTKGKITSAGGTTFNFTRTNIGNVGLKSTVTVPSNLVVRMSIPSAAWRQNLIGGNFTISKTAYTNYNSVAGAPTYKTVCSTNCDGTATKTPTVCNSVGAKPIKYAFYDKATGTVLSYLDDGPGGACASKSFTVKDDDKTKYRYCYTATVGGACVTGWVEGSGEDGTVCPAWIQVAITIGCSCNTAWGTVALNNPVTPRFNVAYIEVAEPGKAVRYLDPVFLDSGQHVIVPLVDPVLAGTVISVKWSSFFDINHSIVIPGYNKKNMESVQLLFGGGKSVTQAAGSVKVLADTSSSSTAVNGAKVS
jgi:hypothetical protein